MDETQNPDRMQQFTDKVRSFVETLDDWESDVLLQVITAEANSKISEQEKPQIIQTAEADPPKKAVIETQEYRHVRRAYIIEPLSGNRTRIIEDEA